MYTIRMYMKYYYRPSKCYTSVYYVDKLVQRIFLTAK